MGNSFSAKGKSSSMKGTMTKTEKGTSLKMSVDVLISWILSLLVME